MSWDWVDFKRLNADSIFCFAFCFRLVIINRKIATINNVKVIYAGSSSKHHDPSDSPYAMYKYLGEEVCKLYRNSYNVNVQIARFYNVYGPHEIVDGDWAAVIGIWRRQVRDNQPITIVGDGEQRRDFTHIDDIVDALIKVMNTKETVDDAWELGTGENYSINEVYQLFKQKFNVDSVYVPDQDGNYRVTLREKNEALEILNWNPTDKLKDYINNL